MLTAGPSAHAAEDSVVDTINENKVIEDVAGENYFEPKEISTSEQAASENQEQIETVDENSNPSINEVEKTNPETDSNQSEITDNTSNNEEVLENSQPTETESITSTEEEVEDSKSEDTAVAEETQSPDTIEKPIESDSASSTEAIQTDAETTTDNVDSKEDPVEKTTEQTAQDEIELKEKSEEPAGAATTDLNEKADIETDSQQETLAEDEPQKDPQAGDAPLDEDGLPKTEEASELPKTDEGAELPAEDASAEGPKIQTFAAGDAPITEEGAEIAPGESLKDSEQKVKDKDVYNLKSEVPEGYTRVDDVISYRLVKVNPNYSDPGYFEMAIRVDTTNRAIDDLYYNGNFEASKNKLDESSIKFKPEKDKLAGADDTVNFKPTSGLNVSRGKRDQITLDYTMSPEDLKTINERKGETIFAISGRYTTPPVENDNEFGKNIIVYGHLIPYPNENNDGDIISVNTSSVNGNDKLRDIPVTKEYTQREISDGVYDTGIPVYNVGEGDKNRITGRVYTRAGKELDDVRVFFDGNSVKLKLPEGAIKDENSVFNGDLKDYKDLEVELFIRPRTDDEISTLYKDYGGIEPDAPDVKSGSKSITNEIANGTGTDTITETLPVNTYDRVRYDNFNTLGRFEISLDDQSNYDVTYWKDGKDTTDKVNRLTAGKISTIEERYNAYNSVLKSDLDAALSDKIAERSLDTSKLKEIGKNRYETEDGWQIEVDEEAKTFNITPPLNA